MLRKRDSSYSQVWESWRSFSRASKMILISEGVRVGASSLIERIELLKLSLETMSLTVLLLRVNLADSCTFLGVNTLAAERVLAVTGLAFY
jgi:hypothetical protein